MQVREVNGRQEVYDTILGQWRTPMTLDRIAKQKPARNRDRRFICPECFANVHVLNYTTGWEIKVLDPKDGGEEDMIEYEITDRETEEYRCSRTCGWKGDYDWFQEIEDQEEEGEQQTPQTLQPYFIVEEYDFKP